MIKQTHYILTDIHSSIYGKVQGIFFVNTILNHILRVLFASPFDYVVGGILKQFLISSYGSCCFGSLVLGAINFFNYLPVDCHNCLSYFTGTFLLFSNSNDGSTARSLPAAFRKAFVHFAFLGFLFFLNAL